MTPITETKFVTFDFTITHSVLIQIPREIYLFSLCGLYLNDVNTPKRQFVLD